MIFCCWRAPDDGPMLEGLRQELRTFRAKDLLRQGPPAPGTSCAGDLIQNNFKVNTKSIKIITYGTERMDQVTLDRLCTLLPKVDFRCTNVPTFKSPRGAFWFRIRETSTFLKERNVPTPTEAPRTQCTNFQVPTVHRCTV